uniref:Hematopoietic cell signal transducer n=1 Tax=Prolemur simus TaxID=1328070 RepID=A0A8C8YC52_PROSS
MVPPGHILLLFLLPVAAAQTTAGEKSLPHLYPGSGACAGCGPLSLPLLAGLVAADAVISLLIVGAVFLCARLGHRPTQEDGRVYINMPGRG